jgi:hypothetical protein
MIIEINTSSFIVSIVIFVAFVIVVIWFIYKLVDAMNSDDDSYQNLAQKSSHFTGS